MDGALKAAADAWNAAEGHKKHADEHMQLALKSESEESERALHAMLSIAASLRELTCLLRAK